ncbi:MAG: hypothetical protein MHM6MM_001766 [Cercozoa sp. M6MM]
MGLSRDSRHKRRKTGGRRNIHQKKRAYEKARPAANTKLGEKRVSAVRVRGGNTKMRAQRLNTGNYAFASENVTRKTRIVSVVYNPTSNELMRTNTLTKNTIVQIDSAPFKQHYEKYYGVQITEEGVVAADVAGKSKAVLAKLAKRQAARALDSELLKQLQLGRLYAAISSRPGQCGRADGYILEGAELQFYLRKLAKH